MEAYLKARGALKEGRGLAEFTDCLGVTLTDEGYLSLLLGRVIELEREPFEAYLSVLVSYSWREGRQTWRKS